MRLEMPAAGPRPNGVAIVNFRMYVGERWATSLRGAGCSSGCTQKCTVCLVHYSTGPAGARGRAFQTAVRLLDRYGAALPLLTRAPLPLDQYR